MLFTTVDFAVFFPIVLLLYWTVFRQSLFLQNLFLVVVSYIFYAFWDWRFLSLIFMSSLLDYIVGRLLAKVKEKKTRKLVLAVSVTFNLGLLAVFKYFNFFVESFVDTFAFFGAEVKTSTWTILLPVGISFYTFQTLSYTLDIYRNRITPTKNKVAFFAFVSFFPQLVAGPIERASNLLPQFEKARVFQYRKSLDGLRLILAGLFQKMVIADNCALLVNSIFETYQTQSGSTLFFGAVLFAFQIYGDFAGYSNIAIGTSKLMGFDLMRNFKYPYLAQNFSDFWRRWHISLSTWFRDYLYIPLGGSKKGKTRLVLNVLIVFLVSGLWHGANWTFVFWGLVHAIFVIPVILFFKKEVSFSEEKKWPTLGQLVRIAFTFTMVCLAWVFFRAQTIADAFGYLEIIFSKSLISRPLVPLSGVALLFGYMILEWLQRHKKHVLDISHLSSRRVRYGIYYAVVFCVFYFAGNLQPFIYFQF